MGLQPLPRRLLALAALAFVAFIAVYVVAVQTEPGQRLDEAALTGGRQAPVSAQLAAERMLRTVSIGSLLAATVLLSAVAWLRRRPALLLLPAAIVGCSLVAAEAFKLVILSRPELVDSAKLVGNSYPSGHTTIFISLGFAAMLVVGPRLRGLAALAAASAGAAAGVFVVTADWHRPSDPIGSYLLTLAVTALLLAGLYGWRPRLAAGEMPQPPQTPARVIARRIEASAVGAALALFFAVMAFAALRYGPEVDWNRFHAAYLLAVAAIVVVAGLVVGLLLRALGSPADARAAARLR